MALQRLVLNIIMLSFVMKQTVLNVNHASLVMLVEVEKSFNANQEHTQLMANQVSCIAAIRKWRWLITEKIYDIS